MAVPTVQVTVNLADFGGAAVEGVIVTAKLSDVDYTAAGIFVSTEPVTATTDATGVAVLSVFPNATVANGGLGTVGTTIKFTADIPNSRRLKVNAVIPNVNCNLVDYVVSEEPMGLPASEAAAASAQAARDVAEGYADAAAASAAEAAATSASVAGNTSAAATSATAAAASATTAQNWATKTDGPVSGPDYSAKYYANTAVSSATDAANSKTLAEAARDLSLGYSKVYTTTTEGLAGTTSGQRFVLRTSDLYVFTVYYNNAGVATLLGTVTLASGDRFTQNVGTKVHGVLTSSDDKTLGYWDNNGFYYFDQTSGTYKKLMPAPTEIESGAATALFGREDSRRRTIEAVDSEGRPSWVGVGAPFDRIPTSDLATALMRESWGDTTYKNFLVDKSLSALGRRVFIHKKLVSDMADANVSSARYPFYQPITDTTGVLMFAQRHISQNNGEELQRQMCRQITIDKTNKTITAGSSITVSEPANWSLGLSGGGNDAGMITVRLPNGTIVGIFNRLKSNFYSDPAWEHVLCMTRSTDGGLTWSAPVEVMNSAKIYEALGAPSGGITHPIVPARNGVYTATGNCILRIPSGPYAGRLVCGIYTEGFWCGAMYSTDDGFTWIRGNLTQGIMSNPAGGANYLYTEHAMTFCSDGSLVMLQRCDSNSLFPNPATYPGNGRRVSTDGGHSWTYTGHVATAFTNSSISLINASLAKETGYEKLIAACTRDPIISSRQQHGILLSYDKGQNWVGLVQFFPFLQGVGYGNLTRLSNGDYVFVYETFNGQGGININPCVGMVYFNEAELMASAQMI